MKIAIIPARGGSKRIPNKNIKLFYGKPIIAWSIEAALASRIFDCVMVSTDSYEIAEIAKRFGAEILFMRPQELSGDFVGLTDVICHATQWGVDQGWKIEHVCCILPTAPLINLDDIRRGYVDLIRENYSYVISVTDFASSIFRSFQNEQRGVKMFFPDKFNARSQDLPTAIHDAAQFYWGTTAAWLGKKCAFGSETGVVKIPRWRVQDIDTEDDWMMTELLARCIADKFQVEPSD